MPRSSEHAPEPDEQRPLVYAVTPCHNRRELTLRFIQQFAALTYSNKRLIVVDDGSTDGTADAVAERHPWVELIRDAPGAGELWWTGATNLGVRRALECEADFVLTINDDATFAPDLLDRLVEAAVQDRLIVGSRLMHADDPGRIKAVGTSCVFRGYDLLVLNHLDQMWERVHRSLRDPLPVDTLCGNGVLIPRAAFEAVGLYDAEHFPHHHADSDFVLRARAAGFVPVVALGAVIHDPPHEQMSARTLHEAVFGRGSDRYHVALRELFRRHGPRRGHAALLAWQYLPFVLPHHLRGRIRQWRAGRRRKADSAIR